LTSDGVKKVIQISFLEAVLLKKSVQHPRRVGKTKNTNQNKKGGIENHAMFPPTNKTTTASVLLQQE